MKKYSMIALILVLTVSLCACGRRNKESVVTNPTVTTPAVTTAPTKPATEPTLETNIPDPEVDHNSTMPGGVTTDPDNGTHSDTATEPNGTNEQTTTEESTLGRMRRSH